MRINPNWGMPPHVPIWKKKSNYKKQRILLPTNHGVSNIHGIVSMSRPTLLVYHVRTPRFHTPHLRFHALTPVSGFPRLYLYTRISALTPASGFPCSYPCIHVSAPIPPRPRSQPLYTPHPHSYTPASASACPPSHMHKRTPGVPLHDPEASI